MLTKNDLILLLADVEKTTGESTSSLMESVISSERIDPSVIKYINDRRQIDSVAFYEKVRKSYNQGKSKLYGNIVKEELESLDIINCLASLQLQIGLFAKSVSDRTMFFKHMRVEEICMVLQNYYKTGNLIPCQKLLRLIKADLKAFEMATRDDLHKV